MKHLLLMMASLLALVCRTAATSRQAVSFPRSVRATAHGVLLPLSLACLGQGAPAQTLLWPVNNPHVAQPYAAFNQIGNNKYHSGLDITSTTGDLSVRAAASGTVRAVQNDTFFNENHGMGNTVIIEHPQLGLYTLYAHLASPISVSTGQFVSAGTAIGVMGNSGCGSDIPPCGIHLHFELKHFGVLGNLHDDLGPVWGYTWTHANLWGFVNPWPYLDHSLTQVASTAVTSSSDQIVRTGPNPFEYTTVVTNVSVGQKFAAFAEHNGWYQVHLPSASGPGSGWIQASPDDSAVLLEVEDPVQSHLGVNVRQSSTTSSSAVSKVWDRQWHVRSGQPTSGTGCGESWHRVHLASNAPGSFGWVCGDFLAVPSTSVGVSFCFGDGSGGSCPCGNIAGPGRGCANSSGTGAVLSGAGTSSATAGDLTLTAQELRPNQPAVLFVGTNAWNNGNGILFGDGLLCVGFPLRRLGVRVSDPSGTATWGPGLGAMGGWGAGDTRRFQVWYSDAATGPCGSTFNFSNGYRVSFTN